MKERRRLLTAQQQEAATQVQVQIATLEKQVKALEARFTALQSVNERFRNDTQARAFGAWLEKQARYYAETPFGQRFLDSRKNKVLPPREQSTKQSCLIGWDIHTKTQRCSATHDEKC
jgi:hypothetical protein